MAVVIRLHPHHDQVFFFLLARSKRADEMIRAGDATIAIAQRIHSRGSAERNVCSEFFELIKISAYRSLCAHIY